MPEKLIIHDFLEHSKDCVILDARSELEYADGHIPGAINFPLLNNEERVIIGTLYKNAGKQSAVLKGFDLAGPKFGDMIRAAKKIVKDRKIAVYCWRGGMRSGIMAWLLRTAGFDVTLLEKGYKSYRNYIEESFGKNYPFIVIGGKTGSGKTKFLDKLMEAGEQVIDLEALAAHRGSSFGALGMPPPPTNEQFENLLAMQLLAMDITRPIWIENESRTIGKIVIPGDIYSQMRKAQVIELNIPIEQRVRNIVYEYACFPLEQLKDATRRVEKKLGNLKMKEAIDALNKGDFNCWVLILLHYYDKTYNYGRAEREPDTIQSIEFDGINLDAVVDVLRCK